MDKKGRGRTGGRGTTGGGGLQAGLHISHYQVLSRHQIRQNDRIHCIFFKRNITAVMSIQHADIIEYEDNILYGVHLKHCHFPPGAPVSSTSETDINLYHHHHHRLDMTLAVAEVLTPNKSKPNQTLS